jgi:hypothetical protein
VSQELRGSDIDLLAAALSSLGFSPVKTEVGLEWRRGSFNKSTGELKVSGVEISSVKKAYSEEVVSYAAKRYGWAVKNSGDGKLNLTRRS